jgi:hypothetical protein
MFPSFLAVLSVSQHAHNKYLARAVADLYDQAIVVSFDIKDRAIAYCIRVCIRSANVLNVPPGRFFGCPVPGIDAQISSPSITKRTDCLALFKLCRSRQR